MASQAEQLASNISLANFGKATELKKRIWFTIGALILFRLLSHVPMPGIDPRAMAQLFNTQRGGVLDFFNTFSGGSLERMSLIALGVGEQDGVERGHVLSLFRNRGSVVYRGENGKETYQLPEKAYGVVFVFRVFNRVSYALVMETDGPVSVGDAVRKP